MEKIVQARILWKPNRGSHFANAVYAFFCIRASEHADSVAFASINAKCKVHVIVGDHDFSKLSLIPDVILIPDGHLDDGTKM